MVVDNVQTNVKIFDFVPFYLVVCKEQFGIKAAPISISELGGFFFEYVFYKS